MHPSKSHPALGRSRSRRGFLTQTSAGAVAWAVGSSLARAQEDVASAPAGREPGTILKSVKIGMVGVQGSLHDKFTVLKELGFDGVELNSPSGVDLDEALKASRDVGLPIHGVVDSIHWRVRLSDPNEAARKQGRDALEQAIRDAHHVGGSSVLLVPAVVRDAQTENHDQCWERSIEQIRSVLPTAARLGVHVLIENVWNKFCYDHDGADDQTADRLAEYIDAIDSPWVGVYFDIGNHRKYGRPEEWIRRLGRRIVKLDIKDWGKEGGWTKIGDGDVDWAAVRDALKEIRFTGWSTAEVGGGDRARLEEISQRMDRALGLG